MSQERQRKIVPVVVAVITDNATEYVLLQRRDFKTGVEGLDGMWELPGGKVEFGENPEQTIRREMIEELDCSIRVIRLIGTRTNVWRYPDFDGSILLIGYHCRIVEPGPKFVGRNNRRWFHLDNINYAATLPGTREFIESASK